MRSTLDLYVLLGMGVRGIRTERTEIRNADLREKGTGKYAVSVF
jgi:hypothetical protein